MSHKLDGERKKRRQGYFILVVIAMSLAAGRICKVTSAEGDTAFLSANDRSRWCTVAALVEDGTYQIDRQTQIQGVKANRRPWGTIDKVRHLGEDGKQHYYSSKPPLFPTMVAWVYFGVKTVTGLTLTDQPIYVARIILLLVNLPLLFLFYYCTIDSIERICGSYWTRQALVPAVLFGTMLLPFSMTLNNHLVAAASTALAMWLYLVVCERLDESVTGNSYRISFGVYALAGAAAGFAAANELPALSMLVFWWLLFAIVDWRSILPFSTGVVLIAAGFFGTNWMAHHSLRPAYAHRGNGADIVELGKVDHDSLAGAVQQALMKSGQVSEDAVVRIQPSDEANRWQIVVGDEKLYALLQKSNGNLSIAHWDDWYEYPGSYWQEGRRQGVDRGEPSRLTYLLNSTIGHYGIFSITPLWLLVPLGLIKGLSFGPTDYRRLSLAILVSSITCLLFYIARPEIDRNYGGVSCCFRWMLWFTPLWLMVIGILVDEMSEIFKGRIAFKVMLAASVFSMATALSTPWQSPWIYQFWQFLGWVQ